MPSVEDLGVDVRRSLRVDGGGPPERTSASGLRRADLVRAEPVSDELGVHPRLAHAACDQLAVLAAEVEHEHRPLLGGGLAAGERDHLGGFSHAGSWARPS